MSSSQIIANHNDSETRALARAEKEETDPLSVPLSKNHAHILRMTGIVCILFGTIQMGLGGGAFGYLANEKYGAWWAGMMVAISGLLAALGPNKAWVVATCVVSFCTMAITITGAVLDGMTSIKFRNIQSCATSLTQSSAVTVYGNPYYYAQSTACLLAANPYNQQDCYCVNSKNVCLTGLQITTPARYVGQSCRNINGNYYQYITASCALCVICFLGITALFIVSLVCLTCAGRTSAAVAAFKNYKKVVITKK